MIRWRRTGEQIQSVDGGLEQIQYRRGGRSRSPYREHVGCKDCASWVYRTVNLVHAEVSWIVRFCDSEMEETRRKYPSMGALDLNAISVDD